jgi:hypothetical protein
VTPGSSQPRNVRPGGNLAQRPRCGYFRSEAFLCRKKGGTTCFAHDGDNQVELAPGKLITHVTVPATVPWERAVRATDIERHQQTSSGVDRRDPRDAGPHGRHWT